MKTVARAAAALAFGLVGVSTAVAQYPDRPVTLVIPYDPGGATDLQARILMPFVEKYLGVPIIIENRGGAGSIIGATVVANAQPDGYTIGHIVFPSSYGHIITGDATYGFESFTPLVNQWVGRNCICVAAGSELEDFEDFLELTRAGTVNLGIVSQSSAAYFAARILQDAAEYDVTYIPFDGGAAIATALLGGHIPVGSLATSEVLEQYRSGAMRALVILSNTRWDQMPEVPTAAELGYEAAFDSMGGYVGPAGLPEDITATLVSAFEAALTDEEYLRIAEERSLQLLPMTNAEYGPTLTTMYGQLQEIIESDLAEQ